VYRSKRSEAAKGRENWSESTITGIINQRHKRSFKLTNCKKWVETESAQIRAPTNNRKDGNEKVITKGDCKEC
jgi:hypothetical protein